MQIIKELVEAVQWLIPAGVILRVVYCLVRAGVNEDESATYFKRSRHAVIFGILAECIWQFKLVLTHYFQ